MPPSEMIATSLVPPPTSTTMRPIGSAMSRPAPIAAARDSSIRWTSRAPALSDASSIARRSTSVIPEGAHMTSVGRLKRDRTTLSRNWRSIASVTSKSAITPWRSGRSAEIDAGVRPIICCASWPTACTSPVRWSIATTDGSDITIPRPRTKMTVLAVPRSMATSPSERRADIEKRRRRRAGAMAHGGYAVGCPTAAVSEPRSDGGGDDAAHPRLHVVDGGREQVALAEPAPDGAQRLQLVDRLHALGHDAQADRLREVDHQAHEGLVALVDGDRVHERLGDLDHVQRQRAQVAQRRVARAEVVERELDAQGAQRVQALDGALGVLHQQRLGDLEHEPARVDAGGGDRVADGLDEAVVLELEGGQVDLDGRGGH